MDERRKLKILEEVMLTGPAAHRATEYHFNPYYGIVVSDNMDPDPGRRRVVVLWEDNVERVHYRSEIVSWTDALPNFVP